MPGSWFEEQDPFSPVRYRYPIEEVLHRRTTPYQHIEVLRSSFFGRMLVLNGVVQLTERDEFVYHEMLVHVPMHVHPGPERVLIVGGGDGGALREALRHPGVTVTLAELDPEVVEVSRAYFPALAESFDSPRATVAYGDAADYVADAGERFDVVLCDLTDPVGPARKLSERPFFEALKRILAPGGVVSMQTESLHFHAGHVKRVQKALRSVFPHTACTARPSPPTRATGGRSRWPHSPQSSQSRGGRFPASGSTAPPCTARRSSRTPSSSALPDSTPSLPRPARRRIRPKGDIPA